MKKQFISFPLFLALIFGGIFFSCNEESPLVDPEIDQIAAKPATSDLTPLETLGKRLYFDKISINGTQSCASCHSPDFGFTGPSSKVNLETAVYEGAIPGKFGDRKPPSAAYATFSPILEYVPDGEGGKLFIGGNFWNGRATGHRLADLTPFAPAAEQALGPFTNPVEQAMPDKKSVLENIYESPYAKLWEDVWGVLDLNNVEENYDRVGLSIAAFEASKEVNQFSSKFDAVMAGKAIFTDQEQLGFNLFNGDALCSACHPSTPDLALSEHALFTDFSFDNLGTPINPNNPIYETKPDFIDYGLGGFLKGITDEDLENNPSWETTWPSLAADNMGKHKVPTLRNVAKADDKNFVKAYMHNGVFKSLKEVVQFYNTRDAAGADWPDPEVPGETVNKEELGNLGLTDEEEDAIVAFMETLSDGYRAKKIK